MYSSHIKARNPTCIHYCSHATRFAIIMDRRDQITKLWGIPNVDKLHIVINYFLFSCLEIHPLTGSNTLCEWSKTTNARRPLSQQICLATLIVPPVTKPFRNELLFRYGPTRCRVSHGIFEGPVVTLFAINRPLSCGPWKAGDHGDIKLNAIVYVLWLALCHWGSFRLEFLKKGVQSCIWTRHNLDPPLGQTVSTLADSMRSYCPYALL